MQTKFDIYKKYLTWEKWVVLNQYANAAIFILFWKREDTHAHTQKLVPCNVRSTSCLEDESRICISKPTNVTPPIIHIPLWNGSYIASTDGVISPCMDDRLFSLSHQWPKMIPKILVANGPCIVPHVRVTRWCSKIYFMISRNKFQLQSYSNNSISRPNLSGSWSDQTLNLTCSQYAIHCWRYWPNLQLTQPNNSDKTPQNKW